MRDINTDVANPNASLKRQIEETGIHIMAGATAGFIEVCIMQPLDIIKTRIQMQPVKVMKGNTDPFLYSGVIDCFKKMYYQEGIMAFYKGIIPPICAETPRRAVKFMAFEHYKKLFMFGSPTPTALTYFSAGFLAGITEGFCINAFEVVKITMQANKDLAAKAPTTWAVTKEIVKKDGFGLNGLNKGLSACVYRSAIYCSAYLGFYYSMKTKFADLKDPVQDILARIALGFTAGTIGSTLNIPFDVAKSRIQGPQPEPGKVKYRGAFRTVNMIYQEEGFLALYKGLLPKILRLGPGGAILIIVYEYANAYYMKTILGD